MAPDAAHVASSTGASSAPPASEVPAGRLRRALAVVLLLLAPLSSIRAQDAELPLEYSKVCFKPRPLPTCRRSLILEFGAAVPVGDEQAYPPGWLTEDSATMRLVSMEIGLLVGSGRSGYGFSLGVDRDGALTEALVRFRYRWWFSGRLAFDLAPTLFLTWAQSNNDGQPLSPFTGIRGSLVLDDRVALTIGRRRVAGHTTVTLGMAVGSGWGPLGSVAAGTAAVIGLRSF